MLATTLSNSLKRLLMKLLEVPVATRPPCGFHSKCPSCVGPPCRGVFIGAQHPGRGQFSIALRAIPDEKVDGNSGGGRPGRRGGGLSGTGRSPSPVKQQDARQGPQRPIGVSLNAAAATEGRRGNFGSQRAQRESHCKPQGSWMAWGPSQQSDILSETVKGREFKQDSPHFNAKDEEGAARVNTLPTVPQRNGKAAQKHLGNGPAPNPGIKARYNDTSDKSQDLRERTAPIDGFYWDSPDETPQPGESWPAQRSVGGARGSSGERARAPTSPKGGYTRKDRVDAILSNNTSIQAAYERLVEQLEQPGPSGGGHEYAAGRASPYDAEEATDGATGQTSQNGAGTRPVLATAHQVELLRGFIDELSELHRSACRLKFSRFDPVNTATALHRLAAAVTHVSMSPAARAQVAWTDLVQRLLLTAGAQVKDFKMASIAPLVWALATLRYPVEGGLLDALAERAVTRLREPPAVEAEYLCPLLWGCAKLNRSPLQSRLFDAAIKAAHPELQTYSLRNLTNLVWALATVEHPVELPFLHHLLNAVMPKLGPGNEQSITNLLWSLARMRYRPQEGSQSPDTLFFERAAEVVMQSLPTCSPQQLSNLAWAFARLRVNPLNDAVVSAVVDAVSTAPSRFTVQHVSNVALAAAILQVPVTREQMQPFIQAILTRSSPDVHAQEICNLCWSLVALDLLEGETLGALAGRLPELGLLEELTEAQSQQLLLAEEQCPDALPRPVHLKAWRVANARHMDHIISGLHKEVVGILESLKVTHTVEGATPDGLLSIDVIIPRPGRTPVAVEVDGPLHFTALPPYRPLGHTALRDRFLQRRGFVFLGVPFYEWSLLRGHDEKRAFLVDRLEAAGVQVPAGDF
eukprot:jgi/Botrbrau1/2272/Bobra.101_2s0095.1